jgi:hypothetical protein
MMSMMGIALVAMQGVAANAETGAVLRNKCEVALKWMEQSAVAVDGANEAGYCFGYVQGAVDSMQFAQDVYSRAYGVTGKFLCLPKDVSVSEIVKAYIKAVDLDKELKGKSQAAAVGLGLKKAFPCLK